MSCKSTFNEHALGCSEVTQFIISVAKGEVLVYQRCDVRKITNVIWRLFCLSSLLLLLSSTLLLGVHKQPVLTAVRAQGKQPLYCFFIVLSSLNLEVQ